ncbi:ABC transporter ATP-binding protein [Metabacillus arenae]|uniref:ABC transporter ATP-binding protein n=1 Tax=Metabacillus arenae TaxID=2771434 RepID=UPI0029651503|nr:ABC transporter ATP-binding protein [Metabacillus arenae]
MKVLEIQRLGKVYRGKVPHRALDNINFSINKGEFVGIMGPSGSGKTTLLNLLATIDEPSYGTIFINGKNPHSFSRNEKAMFRRNELGFVFQDFNLLEMLTVEENIILPLALNGETQDTMEQKLVKVTKKLGIEKLLNKYTYEISGGQLQRTAIARAIINRPSMILADEPTGNLDSKASKDVMEALSEINRTEQTTTFMVTHDPVAASYCHRIIFIKDGKLYNEIYQGDNRQLFFQKILDLLALLGGDNHLSMPHS